MNPENPTPDSQPHNRPPRKPVLSDRADAIITSAFGAIVVTGVIGLVFVGISALLFGSYSWGVFVLAPVSLGFISAVLYNQKRLHTFWQSAAVSLWAHLFLAFLLLIFAMEGIICVLMASPILAAASLLGSGMGYAWMRKKHGQNPVPVVLGLLLLNPVVYQLEEHLTGPPPEVEVQTELQVQASPEQVWQVLNARTPFVAEVGALFRNGVAYPTQTEVISRNDSLYFACTYSQGHQDLPITQYVPNRLLQFEIQHTPEPMKELTFYDHIHAPHLHGYFQVRHGRIELQPQPDGTTRMIALTRYSYDIRPRQYWMLWSNNILDQVHLQALQSIAYHAERL